MSVSVPQRVWKVTPEDRVKTMEFSSALGIPRIAAHMLVSRGIATLDEAQQFLNPSLEHLTDPFRLSGMDAAVARIKQARESGERVLVFGDYDVDGMAGAAILLLGLRRFGIKDCEIGLPSRLIEGYGLSPEHVQAARDSGVSLIITVDNGINARDAADTARDLGIDLLITDHHQIEGDLPHALAIINPKLEDESYPGFDASGAAVAFKLIHALTGEINDLDLVALGTVADIVPLRRENRVLVALGLAQMTSEPRVGLSQLASVAGIGVKEITAEQIAFQLGPRLNAAARLGDSQLPLRLLLTESHGEAVKMAAQLNQANDKRKVIENEIFQSALAQIEATNKDAPAFVLADRHWHPGVIGIVASRIVGHYHRPVALIALDEDGIGRASARSIDGIDLSGALAACQDHLVKFGGHKSAAGFTIAADAIPAFRAAFETQIQSSLEHLHAVPELAIDALVSLSELDAQLLKAIDRLQPFGHMNSMPIFCTHAVTPQPRSVRELKGGHIKLAVQQGPRLFPAIGFRMAGAITPTHEGQPVNIAFTPQFNTWNGQTTIQLVLKDVQF